MKNTSKKFDKKQSTKGVKTKHHKGTNKKHTNKGEFTEELGNIGFQEMNWMGFW